MGTWASAAYNLTIKHFQVLSSCVSGLGVREARRAWNTITPFPILYQFCAGEDSSYPQGLLFLRIYQIVFTRHCSRVYSRNFIFDSTINKLRTYTLFATYGIFWIFLTIDCLVMVPLEYKWKVERNSGLTQFLDSWVIVL